MLTAYTTFLPFRDFDISAESLVPAQAHSSIRAAYDIFWYLLDINDLTKDIVEGLAKTYKNEKFKFARRRFFHQDPEPMYLWVRTRTSKPHFVLLFNYMYALSKALKGSIYFDTLDIMFDFLPLEFVTSDDNCERLMWPEATHFGMQSDLYNLNVSFYTHEHFHKRGSTITEKQLCLSAENFTYPDLPANRTVL